jgi:hypothetical protein
VEKTQENARTIEIAAALERSHRLIQEAVSNMVESDPYSLERATAHLAEAAVSMERVGRALRSGEVPPSPQLLHPALQLEHLLGRAKVLLENTGQLSAFWLHRIAMARGGYNQQGAAAELPLPARVTLEA